MISDKLLDIIGILRRFYLKWSIQHPIVSMAVVILGCVTMLPIVTAATLMPLALLLAYSGTLASHGIFYVVNKILLQGLLLAMFIGGLFIGIFVIATSLSVLHYSYRYFRNVPFIKNN